MLKFAITKKNKKWQSAHIRLLAVNYPQDSEIHMTELSQILDDIRITSQPIIVTDVTAQIIRELLSNI